MKKLESSLKNMLLSLALIAAVCGLALGFVYGITKAKIDAAAQAKKEAALKQVLPEYTRLEDAVLTLEEDANRNMEYYRAYNGEDLVGIAVSTYTKKGFNGEFNLMVGILPNGTVNAISVLKQGETPGLGAKMVEEDCKLPNSFPGKTRPEGGFKVTKDGGEVDAITAATISSRAYCDAVNRAFNVFEAVMNRDAVSGATQSDATSGATPVQEEQAEETAPVQSSIN